MPPEGELEFKSALAVALRTLRARDRFEAEIRARCASKGCTETAIEATVTYLKSKRFLDDDRLAKHLANLWTKEKFWPPARIERELEKRGAPRSAIESVLDSLPDECVTARRFADACRLTSLDLAKRLAAMGFSEDAIEGAASRANL